MRSAVAATIKLCLPMTICGPFCSVPPVGTMTVRWPCASRSRTSVQVICSILTSAAEGVSARTSLAAANAAASVIAAAVQTSRLTVVNMVLPSLPSINGAWCARGLNFTLRRRRRGT